MRTKSVSVKKSTFIKSAFLDELPVIHVNKMSERKFMSREYLLGWPEGISTPFGHMRSKGHRFVRARPWLLFISYGLNEEPWPYDD